MLNIYIYTYSVYSFEVDSFTLKARIHNFRNKLQAN